MKYREKEWLEEQIKIHGANGRQIALANNYSPVTVQRYMKKFNLYKKKEIKKQIIKKEEALYRNKEWLQKQFDLYETVSEVSKQTGYPRTCITRYATRFNIYKRKYTRENVNTVNEDYFEVIDTEEKAYWLGFFMADANMYIHEDGRIQFAIKIQDSDYEHLEKFKKAVNFSGKIARRYSIRKDTKCYYSEIKIYNKSFCNNLIKHGIVPHKTGKEQIPDTIPEDLKKHFIRGFLDGDGSISEYRASICCSEIRILQQIKDYLLNNDIKTTIYSYDIHTINTTSKIMLYKLLKFLYLNSNIYLDRKYKKAMLIILKYEAEYL